MKDKIFDKKIEDQSWEAMRKVLDKEMPEKNNNKIFLYAFLILGMLSISYIMLKPSTTNYKNENIIENELNNNSNNIVTTPIVNNTNNNGVLNKNSENETSLNKNTANDQVANDSNINKSPYTQNAPSTRIEPTETGQLLRPNRLANKSNNNSQIRKSKKSSVTNAFQNNDKNETSAYSKTIVSSINNKNAIISNDFSNNKISNGSNTDHISTSIVGTKSNEKIGWIIDLDKYIPIIPSKDYFKSKKSTLNYIVSDNKKNRWHPYIGLYGNYKALNTNLNSNSKVSLGFELSLGIAYDFGKRINMSLDARYYKNNHDINVIASGFHDFPKSSEKVSNASSDYFKLKSNAYELGLNINYSIYKNWSISMGGGMSKTTKTTSLSYNYGEVYVTRVDMENIVDFQENEFYKSVTPIITYNDYHFFGNIKIKYKLSKHIQLNLGYNQYLKQSSGSVSIENYHYVTQPTNNNRWSLGVEFKL